MPHTDVPSITEEFVDQNGKLMLDDTHKSHNPGYSFYGIMFALAQVEGLMAVINDEIKNGIEILANQSHPFGKY